MSAKENSSLAFHRNHLQKKPVSVFGFRVHDLLGATQIFPSLHLKNPWPKRQIPFSPSPCMLGTERCQHCCLCLRQYCLINIGPSAPRLLSHKILTHPESHEGKTWFWEEKPKLYMTLLFPSSAPSASQQQENLCNLLGGRTAHSRTISPPLLLGVIPLGGWGSWQAVRRLRLEQKLR